MRWLWKILAYKFVLLLLPFIGLSMIYKRFILACIVEAHNPALNKWMGERQYMIMIFMHIINEIDIWETEAE